MNVLDEAIRLSRAGISVVPLHAPCAATGCTCPTGPECQSPGKHPALLTWGTYTRRRPTEAEIETWFAWGEPRNLGIVCGQISGNLIVVDCDTPEFWRALRFVFPPAAQTATVSTGRGYHVYFYSDLPMPTTRVTDHFGHRHHVKADGSYVVAPPSEHASGTTYNWMEPVLSIAHIQGQALTDKLKSISVSAGPDVNSGHSPGWAATLIREGARVGERDDATVRLAGHLLGERRLPVDTVTALLEMWAERCDQHPDPWDGRAIRRKLKSLGVTLTRRQQEVGKSA